MIKVKDVLSVEEISTLPNWVKADIENAVFVEGSNISIEISDGTKVQGGLLHVFLTLCCYLFAYCDVRFEKWERKEKSNIDNKSVLDFSCFI